MSYEKFKFEQMSIGQRIAWLMGERGVKQVELAKAVGITQSAISNLTTDSTRRPGARTLMGICDALRCSPDFVLTGKGDPWSWSVVGEGSENELLQLFRNLTNENKNLLLAIAKSMG